MFTERRVAVSVSSVQQKILHGLGIAYTKTTKYAVTRFARALIFAFASSLLTLLRTGKIIVAGLIRLHQLSEDGK